MPSPRKNETPEAFKARCREYMNARNFARTGRQPIRRIAVAEVPRKGGPSWEALERRRKFLEQTGMYPERTIRPPPSSPTGGGELAQAAKPRGAPMTATGDRHRPRLTGIDRRARALTAAPGRL